ncbi:MAG: hypothetical protein H6766_03880 [Candidatus Peribacteria bacterium]|nr:MAG: hypothetical protein H6766_03880 [Candidatus Peribacteria bacterium]
MSEIEAYSVPNMVHFELSEKKAIELAERLHADIMTTTIGSYLMDVKLGEALRDNKVDQHIQMSSDASKVFLDTFDIGEVAKAKIINCVEAHHGTVPFDCIEAEICANADCYRFIHPRGFFAFLTILGRRESDFLKCLSSAENKMDEKYGILSLDICKQELDGYYNILKDYINDAKNI